MSIEIEDFEYDEDKFTITNRLLLCCGTYNKLDNVFNESPPHQDKDITFHMFKNGV
uniref:Uncharacterized protein n=1 Tax=Sander lucioperca TaxID=283035 RepID=A0A8C9XCV3_SANLU